MIRALRGAVVLVQRYDSGGTTWGTPLLISTDLDDFRTYLLLINSSLQLSCKMFHKNIATFLFFVLKKHTVCEKVDE